MEYALFLGCTVPVRGMHYDISSRKVLERLDVKTKDLSEFACCGFPVENVDYLSAYSMAARNIAIAEDECLDIITLCSACTGTLTRVNSKLKDDEKMREKVNKVLSKIGLEFKGKCKIIHIARLLYSKIGAEKIKEKVKMPLTGIKIAAHYGCHYLKPSEIYEKFDNPEKPESLDILINLTGAESIDYDEKLLCCGGGILSIAEETSLMMTKEKLDSVKKKNADAIVVICPFCAVMYDSNQKSVEIKMSGEKYDIPVLYYPQLLGVAMGYDFKELGFMMNRVRTRKLEKKLKNKR